MVIRGQEHSWLDSILGNQAQNSGYVKVTFTCLETFVQKIKEKRLLEFSLCIMVLDVFGICQQNWGYQCASISGYWEHVCELLFSGDHSSVWSKYKGITGTKTYCLCFPGQEWDYKSERVNL